VNAHTIVNDIAARLQLTQFKLELHSFKDDSWRARRAYGPHIDYKSCLVPKSRFWY